MYDEDRNALAAEYVLGTLSLEERGQAEALLLIDTAFAELVHQWGRRLGELNVMVESVEPPADLWKKIEPDIGTVPASDKVPLAPIGPTPLTKPETTAQAQSGMQESTLLDALASKLLPPEAAGDVRTKTKSASGWLSTPSLSSAIERGTDAVYLARRVLVCCRRWGGPRQACSRHRRRRSRPLASLSPCCSVNQRRRLSC